MNKLRLAVFLSLVLVAALVPAAAKEIDKEFHESFDVGPGVTLHLDHGDGDVSVKPWDQDVIDVKVRYHANLTSVGGTEPDFDVEFRQTGDAVYVTGKETRGRGFSITTRTRRSTYTYTVRAPSYTVLKLRGDDGDVAIESWRADIHCHLDDGNLTLRDVESSRADLRLEDGDLEIDGFRGELLVESDDGDVDLSDCEVESARFRLEDGDLTLRRCAGNLTVQSDDGDVEIDQLLAGSVEIRTSDGDIALDLLRSGDIDLQVTTEDGSVTVGIENGLSTAFSIDTNDGRIRVDLDEVENFDKGRRRASGEISGGNGKIRIRTDDGDVTLREGR